MAGGVATFFSVTLTIICTLCLCGRKRRRKRHRRKAKLKGSVSFTEQEKKLLDVSITTTERPSNAESIEQLNQPDMEMMESASIPLELCEPVHITIESHAPDSGNIVPLSLPLTVFPPPPEFSTSVLPAGAFGNIFISVSVSQEPTGDSLVRYPDLLDIPHRSKNTSASVSVGTGPDAPYNPTQTFATLPRRPRPKAIESADPLLRVGPVYDNMGPRVTAGGSSTLSLPEAEENEIPPPPPPPLCTPLSVDYVSLWSDLWFFTFAF